LFRLVEPFQGEIQIGDADIKRYGTNLRRILTIIPQVSLGVSDIGILVIFFVAKSLATFLLKKLDYVFLLRNFYTRFLQQAFLYAHFSSLRNFIQGAPKLVRKCT
jgi:hypothetical protein